MMSGKTFWKDGKVSILKRWEKGNWEFSLILNKCCLHVLIFFLFCFLGFFLDEKEYMTGEESNC